MSNKAAKPIDSFRDFLEQHQCTHALTLLDQNKRRLGETVLTKSLVDSFIANPNQAIADAELANNQFNHKRSPNHRG